MNYKSILEREFSFLLEYGLKYQYERTAYIGYSLKYYGNYISIIINYEYIDDYLSVGLLDDNAKKMIKISTSVFDACIGAPIPDNIIVREEIENIYCRNKSKPMSRNEFMRIIELYSAFLKKNINNILAWRENVC